MNGKGSKARPLSVSRKEYETNYARTFGKKPDPTPPPDHEDWQRSRKMSDEAVRRLLEKRRKRVAVEFDQVMSEVFLP